MMETLVLRDLDAGPVTRQYEKVLEQLRQGDFRSAEVKKLRGSGLYRAKLDDKNRLVFKLAEHGACRWLLILEVVRNHDYAKARFLNGGGFTEDDFEPAPAPGAGDTPAETLAYVNPRTPALHFLDKPLSFDDAQAAVFETPLPLIVIGSAGREDGAHPREAEDAPRPGALPDPLVLPRRELPQAALLIARPVRTVAERLRDRAHRPQRG